MDQHLNKKKKVGKGKVYTTKGKRRNNRQHWSKLGILRNEVIVLIRQRKQDRLDKMASELRLSIITSRDGWKILKSCINQFSSSLPPLKGDSSDTIVVVGYEKANVLKVFFAKQSVLDGSCINLCDYDIQIDGNIFHSMKISPAEVLGMFRTLRLGKASGPDDIN